jgi:hypothetical protein
VALSINAGVPNSNVSSSRVKVMVWFLRPTEIGRFDSTGLYLSSPAWLAIISQIPRLSNVTVKGLTVVTEHTLRELEAME